MLQSEDLVDGTAENLGKRERQQQAGHVAVALDRIDALARNSNCLRQLLLSPTANIAQLFDTVMNDLSHVKYAFHAKAYWSGHVYVKLALHQLALHQAYLKSLARLLL